MTNKKSCRIFAAAMFAALVMVNIQVDVESPFTWNGNNISIELSVNEVMAQNAIAQGVPDYEMTEVECWYDGEQISICRAADWYCDAGGQDCCCEECED